MPDLTEVVEQAIEAPIEAPIVETPAIETPVDEIALAREAIAIANGDPVPEPAPELELTPPEPDPNADVIAEMATHGIENPSAESVNRFKFLNDENKRLAPLEAELPVYKEKAQYWDQWEGHMQQIGATPEQVGELFSVAADINSQDPERLTNVYNKLQETLNTIGRVIGKPAPGFDPVAAYADIQAEVDAGLPLTVAQELAERRTRDTYTQQLRQTQQQQAQVRQQQEAGVTQAVEKLDRLGALLEKSDPDFARKRAILEPSLREAFASIPPAHWESTFQRAYTALTLPAAAPAPAPVSRPPITHQPIRPAGGASSGGKIESKPPTDEIELMKWTLAQMK